MTLPLEIDPHNKLAVTFKITQMEYIMLLGAVRSAKDNVKKNANGLPNELRDKTIERGRDLEAEIMDHANEVLGDGGAMKLVQLMAMIEQSLGL